MPRADHSSLRFTCLIGLLLAGATALAQPAIQSPAPAPLPSWAVLVLKPVGADRVRPVTGVVVSAQGLVIVPQDFAAPGDQIIILDGGTDIAANGRAATITQQIPDAALSVLYAPALKRQPASLAAAPLANGAPIRLAAFPPAELIAQGVAPVSVSTRVSIANALAKAGEEAPAPLPPTPVTALPNVTGPLLDECGNLVGFSSADGVQSMDSTRTPAFLWQNDLLRVLQSLSLDLQERPCPATDVSATAGLPPPAQSPEGMQRDDISAAQGNAAEAGATNGIEVPALTSEPSPMVARSRWLPWFALLLAVLLAGPIWFFLRRRVNSRNRKLLLPGGDMSARKHEITASLASGPESGEGAEQTDSVLEISGRLSDGAPFLSSCRVNSAAIDVVIGRGGADIVIDSQDVQRQHARLSGSNEMLTISDLGSSRGTWINRVPCLKGEIMFVAAEDTIFLGDVSIQVRIRPVQVADAGISTD